MTTKLFEIRDRLTRFQAIAVRLDPSNEIEQALIAESGYGPTPESQAGYILLSYLEGGKVITSDPYEHSGISRTMNHAHCYIKDNFDSLTNGQVVDVQFILGETSSPCPSDIFKYTG